MFVCYTSRMNSRHVARMEAMLDLLTRAWNRYPDQRLGQLIGNAARDPNRKREAISTEWGDIFTTDYRDPFNVEDDEMWLGLRRLAYGDYDPGLYGPVDDPREVD